MKKSLFCLLLLTLLLMVSVCAEAVLTVTDAAGLPGASVTVDVTLAGNPGFGGMELSVRFDKTALTLIAIDQTGALTAFTPTPVETANSLGEVAFSYAGIANVQGDGKIASLTFTVGDGASGTLPLTLSIPSGAAFTYDGYNMLDLDLTAEHGAVTVRGETPEPPTPPTPTAGAKLTVSKASTAAGMTVTVDVTLAGNPGFGGMELSVRFDKTALTLTAVDQTGTLTAFTPTPVETANALGEVAFSYAGIANVQGDGKIASLTFTVGDGASGTLPLTLSIPSGAAFTYDGYNMLDLDLTAEHGAVTVYAENCDLDGDGAVTVLDVLLSLSDLLNGGEGIDLDGDGNFSLIDVLRLLKLCAA